jgi:excisionase family DNA binding protein
VITSEEQNMSTMANRGDRATSDLITEGEALSETLMVAERLLTIQDVCDRLNVSRTTVWRLMHEHGLRVIRVGGIRRIREHDLVVWLERHCTSSNGGSQASERKGNESP